MSKSFKGAGQKTSLLSIVILTLVWHVPCWACLHPGRSHSSPSPHTHKILPALSLEWGLTCGSSVKMWFVRSRGQYKRLHTAGVSDRQALIYGPGPQQHVPKLHREPCLTCVHWVRSPTQVMGAPLSGSSLRAYVVTGGGYTSPRPYAQRCAHPLHLQRHTWSNHLPSRFAYIPPVQAVEEVVGHFVEN